MDKAIIAAIVAAVISAIIADRYWVKKHGKGGGKNAKR